MKVNLKKLGKIQEEFRLGDIGNFTEAEFLEIHHKKFLKNLNERAKESY